MMDYSDIFSISSLAIILSGSTLAYYAAVVIYRLYLCPVSAFPGPRLAAATYWHEFYYEVVLGGQITFQFERWHRKYGPIIRINPDELHICSPDFIEELFPKARDRWPRSVKYFKLPDATLTTISHSKHRLRRSALSPFFSKASVRAIQPIIDAKVSQLIDVFCQRKHGKDFRINVAFAALASDVVTEYSFGESPNKLGQPDFSPTFHDNMLKGLKSAAVVKHASFVGTIVESLPKSTAAKLFPPYAQLNKEKEMVAERARISVNTPRSDGQSSKYRTIFNELLNSKLPTEEKKPDRLAQEAITILTAGTMSVSWILTVATYYLLSQPDTLRKLKAELEAAMPDPSVIQSMATLENLPYLSGVVKESARLGVGPGRQCRVAPDQPLFLQDGTKTWEIPAGTPVCMSPWSQHNNEAIFPDARHFLPERWIDDPHLDRYGLSFSKGNRICLGANLASAEMYITIARLFRIFGSDEVTGPDDIASLELWETSYRDVECIGGSTLPFVWKGSKGVRIKIKDRKV